MSPPGKPAASATGDPALQALLNRSETDPAVIKNFLLRAIENPEAFLARLAAHRRYLEETGCLDQQTNDALSEYKRRLELMISQPTEGDETFDVPMRFRKGANFRSQKLSVDSAVEIIARVAKEMGLEDLSETRILDIGCGVRFTQAFHGRKIPVKRYHGVDVDPEMIRFLSANVGDDRFSYSAINVFNARYHRSGTPLSAEADIGVGSETFDLICLFSVFTHLEPPDYRAMLELARKQISATGTLIFTTFIDETIPGSYRDSDPSQPLLMALYRESAVREFAAAAGWSVKRIFLRSFQHWVVCAPA